MNISRFSLTSLMDWVRSIYHNMLKRIACFSLARIGFLPCREYFTNRIASAGGLSFVSVKFNHPLQPLLMRTEWKSNFSMQDAALIYLWQLFKRLKPRCILELGSGYSTLALSLYSVYSEKYNKISPIILSIEHEQKWLHQTEQRLKEIGTYEKCKLLHCPIIERIDVNGFKHARYSIDKERIRQLLCGNAPDVVLIDGPPGHIGRAESFPQIRQFLLKKTHIFLDDAFREGENKIMSLWANQFKQTLRYRGVYPLGNGLGYMIYTP